MLLTVGKTPEHSPLEIIRNSLYKAQIWNVLIEYSNHYSVQIPHYMTQDPGYCVVSA